MIFHYFSKFYERKGIFQNLKAIYDCQYFLPDIINCFSDDGHWQHKTKWEPVSVEVSYPQLRYELTARHDQGEQVEEELELIVEEYREEGDDVVLLILD